LQAHDLLLLPPMLLLPPKMLLLLPPMLLLLLLLLLRSVQVEQRDNLFRVFRLCARLQQQPAVMEGKADHLLHLADDLTVAEPAHIHDQQRSREVARGDVAEFSTARMSGRLPRSTTFCCSNPGT
jgi:hypothetical protein